MSVYLFWGDEGEEGDGFKKRNVGGIKLGMWMSVSCILFNSFSDPFDLVMCRSGEGVTEGLSIRLDFD